MDPLRLIADHRGFFTRQEALSAGFAGREITRMVRRGEWHRLRRGAYVFAGDWNALEPVERHWVRCRAVKYSLGDAVALSHVSGVVAHGIDAWGLPLDRVHVTRLDGGPGRVEGDVVHHEGFCADDDLTVVEGLSVLRPERCVLEAASRATSEVALCLLDSGLRAKCFDHPTLEATYRLLEYWPFMHRVAGLVSRADGRSGSVGESRGRHLMEIFGLPRPLLQFEVRRADGTLVGITDWAWPGHGLLGEFDGKVKYGRLLKPGDDPSAVVFQEKVREDELREVSGCAMIRFTWVDYDRPRHSAHRLASMLNRSA